MDQLAGELIELLAAQDDVVSLRQASRFLSRSAIRHRLGSGRWQRVHPLVFVARAGPVTERQRWWLAVLAVGAGQPAYLAGLSALQAHGLRGVASDDIHVLVTKDRRGGRPPAGVTVHRTGLLAKDDVWRGRPPRTRPARSMVNAACWARSDREASLIIATCFQQRIVNLPAVAAVLDRMPNVGRHGLIRAIAQDAAGGATSLGELDFLRALSDAGLPKPVCQSPRRDAAGRLRYRDFAYEEYALFIEIDGAHHLNPVEAWHDMERANNLWRPAERVLRFPAWLVRERPQEVAAAVRAALLDAGWCP
jgi:hypothetical protein